MIIIQMLGALIVILMWGDLAWAWLIEHRNGPATGSARLATAWIWGSGLVSYSLFLGLWTGLSLSMTVALLSIGGLLLWLWRRGRKLPGRMSSRERTGLTFARQNLSKEPELQREGGYPSTLAVTIKPLDLIFLTIIFIQGVLVAFAAVVRPMTDWDAWVNWASKANAIFIDQTLSPTLYDNPARLPTNMDYPLLLPLTEAWFYTWLGVIHEPVAGLVSLLFYLALLLLFYHTARQLASSPAALGFTALLATVPRLERMGHNGLADVPLAAGVLLAFLLVFDGYNNNRPDWGRWSRGMAVACSAALLPWLKNEGWLWLALVSGAWLVVTWKSTRRANIAASVALQPVGVYGAVVLVIAGGWPWFLALTGTYRFTFLPLTVETLMTNLDRTPEIARAMLARLLNPYWNFIWHFVGLAGLIRREKSWTAPAGWLLWPVIAYLLLISASYLFSRFDPYLVHLNNSAERLILQATPLALWWLVGQCVACGWVKGVES